MTTTNNKEYLLGRIVVLLEKVSGATSHDLLPLREEIISVMSICQSYLVSDIAGTHGTQKISQPEN